MQQQGEEGGQPDTAQIMTKPGEDAAAVATENQTPRGSVCCCGNCCRNTISTTPASRLQAAVMETYIYTIHTHKLTHMDRPTDTRTPRQTE